MDIGRVRRGRAATGAGDRLSDRPLYIDIDGTLTNDPIRPWGPPREARIAKVRALIAAGQQVVLWSGGGTLYARAFVKRYRLDGAVALGKPEAMVDDNPDIRPEGRMKRIAPAEFFQDREPT